MAAERMYDAEDLALRQVRLAELRNDLDGRLTGLKDYDARVYGGTTESRKAFEDLQRLRYLRESTALFGFMPQMAGEFHALAQRESTTREVALDRIGQMRQIAEAEQNVAAAEWLSGAAAVITEMTEHEKTVRDGLRVAAREDIMPRSMRLKAPNQIEGQMADRNAAENLETLRNIIKTEAAKDPVYATPEYGEALRAVFAEDYELGQCGEKSALDRSIARAVLPGTIVAQIAHTVNHSITSLGPVGYPESVIIDSWPTKAKVTTWKNYGMASMIRQNVPINKVADGFDYMADVRVRLAERKGKGKEAAPVLEAGAPMTREEAEARQFDRGAQFGTWDITHTTATANSDSSTNSSPTRSGMVISDAAFMSTLGTGYQHRGPRHQTYESYTASGGHGSSSRSQSSRRKR